MAELQNEDRIMTLTAQIVSAWVTHNEIGRDELPDLVKSVYRALSETREKGHEEEVERPVPAVPPENSVFADHILCLECGQGFKSLKRHLRSTHGLTARAYLEKWCLPQDYPLVAPDYSKQRSHLAKRTGLGKS